MKNNKIKTFEDACAALKISTELPDVSKLPEKHRKAIIAHYKLVIITEALNEDWEPNWDDSNEWKYIPWLRVKATKENPAGVGFSNYAYGYGHSYAGVGSRLCLRSSELALYMGEKFQELYKDYFLIQP